MHPLGICKVFALVGWLVLFGLGFVGFWLFCFLVLGLGDIFSKMRHEPSVKLGITSEQSRRMVKDQNASLYFPLRRNASKQMLQHFSTETLKLMGLKMPKIHLSISKKNIKIPSSELLWSSKPFEAFILSNIKHCYSPICKHMLLL